MVCPHSHVKLAIVLAVSLAGAGCTRQQPVQAKQEAGPVQVKASPVTSKDIRRVVQSVGTLFPFDESVISAEIEGRVAEVNADLGDRVNKGQVLVRISDEEQRYLLAQTEAQLRMALERVGLRNENDRIKDIRDASEVRRAQADLFDAEQHYNRMRSLVNQGIGSRAELDQAQARYKSQQAAYDATVNQARNLLQDIERNKASLDLQRKTQRHHRLCAIRGGCQRTPGHRRPVCPGEYAAIHTRENRSDSAAPRSAGAHGAMDQDGSDRRRDHGSLRRPQVPGQGMANLPHCRPEQAHLYRRSSDQQPGRGIEARLLRARDAAHQQVRNRKTQCPLAPSRMYSAPTRPTW